MASRTEFKRDLFLQLYTNLGICSLLSKCQQISEEKIWISLLIKPLQWLHMYFLSIFYYHSSTAIIDFMDFNWSSVRAPWCVLSKSHENIEFHSSKSHLTPLGSLHLSKKFHTAPEDDGVVSLRLCFRRSAGAHVEAAMPLTTAIPSLIVVKSIPFC